MKKLYAARLILLCLFCFSCGYARAQQAGHNLVFSELAASWDEAIPLGNGILGALVWEKEGRLRLALDRADLWDLRPTPEFESEDFRFSFVYDQVVNKKDIGPVRKLVDEPYSKDPGPTKIPAGAIEFNTGGLGKVRQVSLSLDSATCFITWESGARATIYIHAGKPVGRIRFENLPTGLIPVIDAPEYSGSGKDGGEAGYEGISLQKLGYPRGTLTKKRRLITWRQPGYGDFSYDIALAWTERRGQLEATFSVTSEGTPYSTPKPAAKLARKAIRKDQSKEYKKHLDWWKDYWSRSRISLPDPALEKQYYLEMYKFGAASRQGAPPITLQAVWTADNGGIPPWKGDFHNDLNTQLSYWPGYTANLLEETAVFTDWLWMLKPKFNAYTKKFYGISGLNAPGINTLTGSQMGGWNQYSCGSTVAAWLGHHFYLQWKYSMDSTFLRQRAYPWIKDVAAFFDAFSVKDQNGFRKLPLSSSPEIHDNRLEAWYTTTTNFDLALVKFIYSAASEMALELGLPREAEHYNSMLREWPDYALNPADGSLAFAAGDYYSSSHRHFSHLLAFHPLGLLDLAGGEEEKKAIRASVAALDKYGSDNWTGYSYAWLANMKARLFDGDGAAEALRIFAKAFCLKNSFHVNGDQTKSGYSNFTYRPFTLEGNFAFASGIQEMLLQSHTGTIRLMPALPDDWKDVSFEGLRAQGAFLVSATMENGALTYLKIRSEKGGKCSFYNPFSGKNAHVSGANLSPDELQAAVLTLNLQAGQEITIKL